MHNEQTLADRAVWLMIAAAAAWFLVPELIYIWLRWLPTPEWWPALLDARGFARMLGLGLAIAGVVMLLRIRKISGP
ncbi:hypothetical protein [Nesterenkonia sp. K-15-9-6]|uniref:hypothetical protein n=1 Tax=Nesterenkonia sp. K-15-9-6 TaxID=3093918 RepID=UPI0040443AB4